MNKDCSARQFQTAREKMPDHMISGQKYIQEMLKDRGKDKACGVFNSEALRNVGLSRMD